MRFISHYSSSKGNLYEVVSCDERLLIECGVTWKKIRKALNNDLQGIAGCLITHSHEDHCKAHSDIAGNGIDVYHQMLITPNVHRYHTIKPLKWFTVGRFSVLAFPTKHDVDSVGYLVKDGQDTLLFATDTYNIEYTFKDPFNIVAIECSYDRSVIDSMLKEEKIHPVYANRLIKSHFEINNTKKYLRECCNLLQCRQLFLLHMSETLNREKTIKEFESEFRIPTS